MGDDFKISAESAIICTNKIQFGKNCLISWDDLIMDTDFHTITDKDKHVLNPSKEIIIGDNVWIGCISTILKGSKIGNDVVVAANSLITKSIEGNNQIIGDNPTRVLKENISWSF